MPRRGGYEQFRNEELDSFEYFVDHGGELFGDVKLNANFTITGNIYGDPDLKLYSNINKNGKIYFGDNSWYNEVDDELVIYDRIGLDTDPTSAGLSMRGMLNFVGVTAPSVVAGTTVLNVPGNVDNGTHRYKFAYKTALGTTVLSGSYVSVTITDKTAAGQVNVKLPISLDRKVTGIQIFRTLANTISGYQYVTEIDGNATTDFIDNIADSGLGGYSCDNRDDYSRGHLYIGGSHFAFFGRYNIGIGLGSLANGLSICGYYLFGLGPYALNAIESGSQDVAIGPFSQFKMKTGSSCTTLGFNSLYSSINGQNILAFAANSLYLAENANDTIAIGVEAGYKPAGLVANASINDTKCLFIGNFSGNAGTSTLTNAMAFGYYATVGASNTLALGGIGTYAIDVVIGKTTALSVLDVYGSIGIRYDIVSVNTTLTKSYGSIEVDTAGVIITLEDAITCKGRFHIIDNSSTGNITINNSSGVLLFTVTPDASIIVQSNGITWRKK